MGQTLRAVLVGCGGISRTWLNAAKDISDLDIVGLIDLELEAARQRAQEFNLSAALLDTDLKAALKDMRPDVVFDCTVPEAHVHVTLDALRHGCHVLGEKPLADTMENAERMVAAAQQADRIYAVCQNRRYDPRVRRLKAFLESGGIGAITAVHSDFFIGAHFGGFRDHMAHVLLIDMAIHTFDVARLLTAAGPRSVYCREWNPRGSWYDRDAAAVALFEMSSDIVYTYRGSWCAEGLNTSWESEWRVVGERGSVKWDGRNGFEVQVVQETGGFQSELRDVSIPPFDDEDKIGGHAGVIRDFIRCVRTGARPETVCTDNIKSLAMVFGAVESAKRDKRVQIN
jgi:predicted dehydrogenase